MELIPLAALAALAAALVYMIIGIIPGTDETASIAPVILILVLFEVPPAVILAVFMAAIAAMETANTIPSAIATIPGSTMAVPFLEPCRSARRLGIPHIALRKMLAASVIGTLIALPLAIVFGQLVSPLADTLKHLAPLLFFIGAFLIALASRSRAIAVLSLLPFCAYIAAMQMLSNSLLQKPLFISYFMGIALGPMIVDALSILSPVLAASMRTSVPSAVVVAREATVPPARSNPFRILGRRQSLLSVFVSIPTSLLFVLSPVGMTVLVGEILGRLRGSALKRLLDRLVGMDAVTNSTYVAETLIPLIAVGLPLSPMALGPAAPLFNAPPFCTIGDASKGIPMHNIHTMLTPTEIAIYAVLGSVIGLAVTYSIALRRARQWTVVTLRLVSMEALATAFVALAAILSFHEGGFVGLIATFTTALFAGLLYRIYGVHLGVLYMAFYGSAYLSGTLLPALTRWFP